MFSIPVCNIFKETVVDGQLCYKADVNKFRNKVDKKRITAEGFVFILDYNDNRMVEVPGNQEKQEMSEESMIYIETIGKRNLYDNKGLRPCV